MGQITSSEKALTPLLESDGPLITRTPRPNVIGSALHRTPHLDQMAREGISRRFPSCTTKRPLRRRLDGRLEVAMPSPAALFNLHDNIRETREVSAAHPDVVRRPMALADRARADLGDLDQPGAHQRPAELVEHPRPLTRPAPA